MFSNTSMFWPSSTVQRSLWLTISFALACSDSPAPPDAAEPMPNVLLITVDTLRADRLGAYGFDLDVSPAIDKLAEQGALFTRAISGASFTSPSHASIMTSRYTRQHTIGYENGRTRLEGMTTLAEQFSQAGYRTGAFVGNVLLQRRSGFDRGFDHYDDEVPNREQNRQEIFERIAEQTTQRVLEWLEAPDPRPVFLWVHYQDPHGPYTPPSEFRGRFNIPPRPFERPLPILDGDMGFGGIPLYQKLGDLTLPSIYESRYVEEIAYADEWIGRLISKFEDIAQPGMPIVAFTGDHGESLGEANLYFIHGSSTLPDQGHVPLIIRAPGVEPSRSNHTVHHVDIMPTLLELAGLEVPVEISGVALGPILRGSASMPERVVYCDDGYTLTAYGPDTFVRVQDIKGAWTSLDPDETFRMAPQWAGYRWPTGAAWTPEPFAGGAERGWIREYMRSARPMIEAPAITPVMTRMLRKLGYIE
jgi:arylsulfatase A-like enzyme